ncbi:3-hydroxyacyl-CoA dehydrogenase [Arcobacter sp. LA11]|uniref:3-hydroxyacyl-CoA dehydrogenase n=1 Tax=Arcobacter sp. LA11 TaxID=1898176 RepID=UPI000933E1E8|nr:3-hydroxyacyl-CoA dehydrogenase [Arcobacter sp. LA11]
MKIDNNSIIGIVGAGIMGRGIAQVAARAGHKVILYDNWDGAVDNAMKINEKELSKLVSKGKITQEAKDTTISLMNPTMEINDLAPCDLIIEAIIENKEIKQEIFKQLEDICGDVVIASNTSSISISALANGLKKPENMIGIHFFNPAPIMKLVEVISGLLSDQQIIEDVHTLISSWGKKAVYVKSSPGFIVNRIARPFYAEALRVYEEGVSSFATIDEVIRSGGKFRMGPFELMDLIGNDTNYSVTQSTFDSYYQDPRFKPSLTQQEFSQAGLLGRKSGAGFYKYEDGKQQGRNDIRKVAPSNNKISEIYVYGSLGVADELIPLFKKAGIKVVQVEGDGYIEFNEIKLFVANGKMASEISKELSEKNIAQLDINIDYELSSSVTIATSLLAQQHVAPNIAALFSQIEKETLTIKDSPAMIMSRTICMLINEASSTVTNGVCDECSADIAMENGVNYPIGPFKWADKLGTEFVLETLDNLESFYKDTRYRADRSIVEQSIIGGKYYE